jgi:hypothetical protein
LPGDSCIGALDCAYSATTYGYPACGADGRCKCSPRTGICHTDAHCCEGACVDGLCAAGPDPTSCVSLNQASKDGADCCPALKAPGGPGTVCCGAPGRTCSHPYECCTNTCGSDGRCP